MALVLQSDFASISRCIRRLTPPQLQEGVRLRGVHSSFAGPNGVLNAAMRLDRHGDRASRKNQRLIEAARVIGFFLDATAPPGSMTLPRGYELRVEPGGRRYLVWPGIGNDALLEARALAEDIATGWLYEVAEMLEGRDRSQYEAPGDH